MTLSALFALAAEVIAQEDLVAWTDMVYGFANFLDDAGSCNTHQLNLR
jgi:hypothetical protein